MIRKARIDDLDAMYEIRLQASKRMHQMGIDQWQDEQPTKAMFLEDIKKQQAFVYTKHETILGIATLQLEPEVTYEPYVDMTQQAVTCHRIAVSNEALGQGIAKAFLAYMETYAKEHRIHMLYVDTHPNNTPMKQLLEKHGMIPIKNIELRHLRSSKRILFMKTLTF